MGMREGELNPDQGVGGTGFQADQAALFRLPSSGIGLALYTQFFGGRARELHP
jgi:hypothetical protein